MLKRYQVLINDWLAKHLKLTAERYDISFSEIIRVVLCLKLGELIQMRHPKCKSKIKRSDIAKVVSKRAKGKDFDTDEFHKFLSKVYFETRKAIECWNELEKRERATRKKVNY